MTFFNIDGTSASLKISFTISVIARTSSSVAILDVQHLGPYRQPLCYFLKIVLYRKFRSLSQDRQAFSGLCTVLVLTWYRFSHFRIFGCNFHCFYEIFYII